MILEISEECNLEQVAKVEMIWPYLAVDKSINRPVHHPLL